MACGCIVIASNMAGPTSYIKDQENGFFFKPRDGKDLNQKNRRYFINEWTSNKRD